MIEKSAGETKTQTTAMVTQLSDPDQKKAAARRRTRPQGEATDLQRDVVVRLQGLRSAAKQVSRSYLSNLERDILEIIDAANGKVEGGRTKGLKTRTLERISDILGNLSLKPEKGRRKDFKRIEQTLAAIMQACEKDER